MSHTYSTNLVHCVFSTKGRVDMIPNNLRESLYAYVFGTARNLKTDLIAIGGTSNHIHILLSVPPKLSLSDAVRDLKANSSRWMREQDVRFAWQEGFGAFSVSPSQVSVVKSYIRNQQGHHRRRNFEEEFVLLLKKSGVAFDPKYVFG